MAPPIPRTSSLAHCVYARRGKKNYVKWRPNNQDPDSRVQLFSTPPQQHTQHLYTDDSAVSDWDVGADCASMLSPFSIPIQRASHEKITSPKDSLFDRSDSPTVGRMFNDETIKSLPPRHSSKATDNGFLTAIPPNTNLRSFGVPTSGSPQPSERKARSRFLVSASPPNSGCPTPILKPPEDSNGREHQEVAPPAEPKVLPVQPTETSLSAEVDRLRHENQILQEALIRERRRLASALRASRQKWSTMRDEPLPPPPPPPRLTTQARHRRAKSQCSVRNPKQSNASPKQISGARVVGSIGTLMLKSPMVQLNDAEDLNNGSIDQTIKSDAQNTLRLPPASTLECEVRCSSPLLSPRPIPPCLASIHPLQSQWQISHDSTAQDIAAPDTRELDKRKPTPLVNDVESTYSLDSLINENHVHGRNDGGGYLVVRVPKFSNERTVRKPSIPILNVS